MEPELSGIFWVKMVAKNIELGSPGTHFMHMGWKKIFLKDAFPENEADFTAWRKLFIWLFDISDKGSSILQKEL